MRTNLAVNAQIVSISLHPLSPSFSCYTRHILHEHMLNTYVLGNGSNRRPLWLHPWDRGKYGWTRAPSIPVLSWSSGHAAEDVSSVLHSWASHPYVLYFKSGTLLFCGSSDQLLLVNCSTSERALVGSNLAFSVISHTSAVCFQCCHHAV
jgi:hypothetical protein